MVLVAIHFYVVTHCGEEWNVTLVPVLAAADMLQSQQLVTWKASTVATVTAHCCACFGMLSTELPAAPVLPKLAWQGLTRA